MPEISSNDVDAIIVGGGIFGCSIAYYYAKNNPRKKVILLERNELNNAATSRAAALMNIVRTKKAYIPLSLETYSIIKVLEEELDESLDMKTVGMMHVAASRERVDDLENLMSIADEFGISNRYLSQEEAHDMAPWLKTDEALKIGFIPDEGYCDPYLLGSFFARGAKKYGADIKLGVEVNGLIIEKNKVQGVRTSVGLFYADVVVDAAGVWSPILAKELGKGIPMAPVRSQYWITEKSDIFPTNSPMVILPDAQAYARPESGSLLFGIREKNFLVVSPEKVPKDISEFVFSPDKGTEDLVENGERLARFFPQFYDIGIQYYIAGFSGYTPDAQLTLGSFSGFEGFLVASGCCGAGIAVSGGVGLGIAELAAGRESPFDFSVFSPDRYGELDSFSENWLNKCAAARSNKVSG